MITVLTGPAIIMFLGFVIFPVALAAYYGFYRWQGYGAPTDFVGLGNYALINLNDALYRVPGVGQVVNFGASEYAIS